MCNITHTFHPCGHITTVELKVCWKYNLTQTCKKHLGVASYSDDDCRYCTEAQKLSDGDSKMTPAYQQNRTVGLEKIVEVREVEEELDEGYKLWLTLERELVTGF